MRYCLIANIECQIESFSFAESRLQGWTAMTMLSLSCFHFHHFFFSESGYSQVAGGQNNPPGQSFYSILSRWTEGQMEATVIHSVA